MRSLILCAVVFAVSVSVFAASSAPTGRCNLCGVTWNSWTHFHPDCKKFSFYRGKVKSLPTPYVPPKAATQEEILKRVQQLDAAYREKFPGQPEESYPKFN